MNSGAIQRFATVLVLFALATLSVCGCARKPKLSPGAQPAPEWFADITETSGAQFRHDVGKIGTYFMPESIGSGAAMFDYDDDGRMDLLFLQNAGPRSASTHQLFHQEADGRFTNVTAGSGLGVPGWGMGVAAGDADNDRLPDVLITEYGSLRFFHNDGAGRFSDRTAAADLSNPLWGVSAAWFDYDRDGWLDLVVVNYVDYPHDTRWIDEQGKRAYPGPSGFPPSVPRVFHNLGVQAGSVHFEDVTVASGLSRWPGPGLGVVCADFDGDRWPDIFISNDGQTNRLLINQRDGTFREEGAVRGVAYNAMGVLQANMGVAVGDVDGDGLFDLLSTHLSTETHTLWRQQSRGNFLDITAASGITRSHWRGTGFGTVFADFNRDGAPDLVIANGSIKRLTSEPAPRGKANDDPFWNGYEQRSQLFANDRTGKFSDISPENPALCGTAAIARGVAIGDLDNDGAPDLVVTRIAADARIYRNIAPRQGHWLGVRAILPKAGGRDAIGAEIAIVAGGRRRVARITPSQSYLCSNDPRVLFALGDIARVDSIEVVWPDGTLESFPGSDGDRYVTLREGEGLMKANAP